MASIMAPVVAREFIGRRAERDFLLERWNAALASQGSLVLIEGDAGAGKSRLVQAFRTEASGAFNATGRCLEYASASFAPIADVLAAVYAKYPVAAPPAAHLRSVLRSIVPEIGPPYDDQPRDENLQQRWMYEAIAQTLNRLSATVPAIILIEDLHWADHATLNSLKYLAALLQDYRILVIATCRPDDPRAAQPLSVFLNDVVRIKTVLRLKLQPIPNDDARRIIASALPPATFVRQQLTSRIVKSAAGNPLFLEELLKHLLEQDGEDADIMLPSSVTHAVRERLLDLTEEDRGVIEVASVIGFSFSVAQVSSIVALDAGRVEKALLQLRAHNLIGNTPDDGFFRFRHDLIRNAVHAGLELAAKRRYHLTAAQELDATDRNGERIEERAYHWAEAGDIKRAAVYSEQSGDRSARLFAHADAAEQYERAIKFNSQYETGTGELFKKAGEAFMRIGALEEASKYLTVADARLPESNREARVHLYRDFSYIAMLQGAITHSEQYAIRALETSKLPVLLPDLFLQAAIDLATLYCQQNRYDDAAPLVSQAKELRHLGQDHFRSIAATFTFGSGDLRTWREIVEEALAQSASKNHFVRFAILYNSGQQAIDVGDYKLAALVLNECIKNTDSLDLYPHGEMARVALAEVSFETGDFAQAIAALERTTSGSTDYFMETGRLVLQLWLGFVREDSSIKDRDRVLELIQITRAQKHPVLFCALAGAYAIDSSASRNVDVDALLREAINGIEDTVSTLRTMLAVAILSGDRDLLRDSRAKLSSALSRRRNPRSETVLHLFDAYAAFRCGNSTAALTNAQAAKLSARAIGAGLYVTLADNLIGRAGKSRRGPSPSTLSPRQVEIARLIAAGRTNREIADTLSITERTVESHVSATFSKLGLRSRTELAVLAQKDPF